MAGNADSSLQEVSIVIVGAGPVGMLTALNLSRFGTSCLLAERRMETTRWPKMDWTNPRTMELLRMMGLAEEYRNLGRAVGPDWPRHTRCYYSCDPGAEEFASWTEPSTNEKRKVIAAKNDGSQPAEPGQRISQVETEAWLRKKCLACPSIDGHYGWRYLSHTESPDGVESVFQDFEGRKHTVRSTYLVGADGGSSRVRQNAGLKMFGLALPTRPFLVHFRSKEFAEKRPLGRFWHIFSAAWGVVIDQDEDDTFTAHMALADDQDPDKIDPYEWVYKCVGGTGQPYRFKIDEILVTSAWQINFAIAERYLSTGGRVIIGGDAAHRNPPFGGYGMNTGVEDAIQMAWRLSALVKGYGGPELLQSYDNEQRPVMMTRLERCFDHVQFFGYFQTAGDRHPNIGEDSEAGRAVRAELKDKFEATRPETEDYGIELDTRYRSSVIYVSETDGTAPPWNIESYTPSTYPGARVPHVFLGDGKTSTLDTLTPQWSLVAFTDSDHVTDNVMKQTKRFIDTASAEGVPVASVIMAKENVARAIWGSTFVLVRPDSHVAWRAANIPDKQEDIQHVLRVVTGWETCPDFIQSTISSDLELLQAELPSEMIGVGEA